MDHDVSPVAMFYHLISSLACHHHGTMSSPQCRPIGKTYLHHFLDASHILVIVAVNRISTQCLLILSISICLKILIISMFNGNQKQNMKYIFEQKTWRRAPVNPLSRPIALSAPSSSRIFEKKVKRRLKTGELDVTLPWSKSLL